MGVIARCTLSLLTLVAIANSQDTCSIRGLTESHIVGGIRMARGSIALGAAATEALLLRTISTTGPTPPILFSHSDITIAHARTDLRPIAVRLARRGATVLILERAVLWEPRDDAANRAPVLVDCASKWLLTQPNMDVAHAVYVGPRLEDNDGSHRTPLALTKLRPPARGRLWVPLAESADGYDTIGFTEAETQNRLVNGIEAHWSVDVTEK